MKNHKTLTAFIILALLLAVFLGVTLYTNILSYMELSSQADLKVSGMVDTLNRVQDHINALETEFRTKTENTMELMSMALRPFVKENTYDGPEVFEDEATDGNYDGIVFLCVVLSMLGLCWFVSKHLNGFLSHFILRISRGMTAFYCLHWVFVRVITNVILYLVNGTQELPEPQIYLLSLAICIVTTILVFLQQDFKARVLKKKEAAV